jgi:hypothetical protein
MINNNTRTFYFLRDNVSKQFYTGEHNQISNFNDAAVYYKEKNAKLKIKEIISNWLHDQKYPYGNRLEEVNLRKNIENWGIEIISRDVTI